MPDEPPPARPDTAVEDSSPCRPSMPADPPSPWSQRCPRSVRLAPEKLLVPAATLRVLLGRHGRLSLVCAGFGMEPVLEDGLTVVVDASREARPGDIVLCDMGGWGDLLRLRRMLGADGREVGLDAFPRCRAVVSAARILGVLGGAEGRRARRWSRRMATSLGLGALRFAVRRVRQAPRFGDRGTDSVGDKYRDQVEDYRRMRTSNLDDIHVGALRRGRAPGSSILVAGCGAGGELVHLTRLGWRVTGFDLLAEMVEAARAVAAEARVGVELFQGDVRRIDLAGRRFDAIYMTPQLYAFIPGRQARIATLRRLRDHLAPGGPLLLSLEFPRTLLERAQSALGFVRLRSGGVDDVEWGDWYTWYLTRAGDVGYSYLHRFTRGGAEGEARAAGFARLEWLDAHLLVTDPASGVTAGAEPA